MYCILNHRKYSCLALIIFLGLGMVFQASAIDPTADKAVMLYFSFDEGVGDTVKDLSGNNNDDAVGEFRILETLQILNCKMQTS